MMKVNIETKFKGVTVSKALLAMLTSIVLGVLAVVCVLTMLLISKPSQAFFGFGGVNSATETTQMLNNVELMASVNKQAVMVSTQFKQYMTELNQWSATLQNIVNLPMSVYSTVMGPYNTVVGSAQNFASGIHNLQSAASRMEGSYRAKLAAAGKQGISGGEYAKLEAQLAREKGGVYKERLQADIRAIDDFKVRAQAVRDAATKIPALKGNVESLALLNQQLNLAVNNLEEMRAVMVRESSDKTSDKVSVSAAQAARAEQEAARRAKSKADRQKMENLKLDPIIMPWQR